MQNAPVMSNMLKKPLTDAEQKEMFLDPDSSFNWKPWLLGLSLVMLMILSASAYSKRHSSSPSTKALPKGTTSTSSRVDVFYLPYAQKIAYGTL